jgi:hypothetical protein
MSSPANSRAPWAADKRTIQRENRRVQEPDGVDTVRAPASQVRQAEYREGLRDTKDTLSTAICSKGRGARASMLDGRERRAGLASKQAEAAVACVCVLTHEAASASRQRQLSRVCVLIHEAASAIGKREQAEAAIA